MKCLKCKKEEGRGKDNICRWCWRKDYTEKNRQHIREVARVHQLKHKEKYRKQAKEWVKKQGEDYQSKRMKKRYINEREKNLIRQKTKKTFSHLKIACLKCKVMDVPLQFHHLEPYAYDHFQILCKECHGKAHMIRDDVQDTKTELEEGEDWAELEKKNAKDRQSEYNRDVQELVDMDKEEYQKHIKQDGVEKHGN